ncbi:hypothetical protein GCM10007276_25270 [Agaricicola taiwanensis]|uniref:Ancillary SecYEG translocon subunit/Cell division coordinator CpoB TPR domain-containing protein n=1 Tax=Agaricicola taiwanensis TaxID=591372 RepID=A0A8J2YJT1_9RHOB|nr:tetratricopeptide repeat protein [Agaricicola taiwanensis]GGE47018.1 hypothetical protein GCM10007276_25270 [Agaricicola taiwanensis]
MSDIFDEVADDLRRERAAQAWKKFAPYVIAVAVLIVVGVGGYRTWEWYEAKQSAESGDRFAAALALAEDGKAAEALAAFQAMGADAPQGYATLARFRAASEQAAQDAGQGIAAFTALANDTGLSKTLRDLATLRAGLLELDQGNIEAVRQRLEPLAEPGNPWRHQAREALVFSAMSAEDDAAAKRWLDLAEEDTELPPGVRSRLQIASGLLAGRSSTAAD